MIAYMWNTDKKAMIIWIINAFKVATPPESAMQAADPESVPAYTTGSGDYNEVQALTLIRVWSGHEPEMITDEHLLEPLGLDDHRVLTYLTG